MLLKQTKFKWVVAVKIKVQRSVCDAHSVQESPYKADLPFWMMFSDFPKNLKLFIIVSAITSVAEMFHICVTYIYCQESYLPWKISHSLH